MQINRRTLLAGSASLAALPCIGGAAMAGQVAKGEVPEGAITLVVTFKTKPGQEESVKADLLTLVEPTRKEPGCLCYNLHQSKSDKSQFLFYEQWADQKSLDTHSNTPGLKAVVAKLKGRLETSTFTSFELLK
jgi:quinol monooxygenase YgiN